MLNNKIKIAIADDHPMVISGLISLLSPYKHILITGTYSDGNALMNGLSNSNPDVLLLDILLPGVSGKDLVPLIAHQFPDIKILVLTSLDAPAMVTSMLRRGCKGYLLKGAGPKMLVDAIEAIYNGEEYIDPTLKEQLLQNVIKFKTDTQHQSIIPELTQREKEIIRLIAKEYTTKEISEQLFISYRTAENHRYNLIQKLDVKNTAGLVKVAIQLGLIE
ncbi:response regulator transcription factor [Taibaiella lutea]|uniref:Response regulator transcription factor n=1 Tax=Taibaiella lutea TaxID=2608001 RepID=A0A5M6CB54_9BACT|nr:response regulator transcription factor [Taibaiella lutea]KAA5532241.1 response regulator transcription factor [Taibaiella lutea]